MLTFQEVSYCNEKSPHNFGGFFFMVIIFEWISYMLSKEEYEKGGYKASVSFYGPTLGPLIVDRIVDAATSFQLQLLAKN